jgi:hypothetical protein
MDQSNELMPPGADAAVSTLALLGQPPLARGEDVASYEELLGRIVNTLHPSDSLEEVWVRDIVDLVWEALRLRRAKANTLTRQIEREIRYALRSEHSDADEMAQAWAEGDENAESDIPEALAEVGSSIDTCTVEAMWVRMGELERLDRMLVSAEARRSAALRELDHHRSPLARKLRRAIAEVEEAAGSKPALAADAPPIAALVPQA